MNMYLTPKYTIEIKYSSFSRNLDTLDPQLGHLLPHCPTHPSPYCASIHQLIAPTIRSFIVLPIALPISIPTTTLTILLLLSSSASLPTGFPAMHDKSEWVRSSPPQMAPLLLLYFALKLPNSDIQNVIDQFHVGYYESYITSMYYTQGSSYEESVNYMTY
ncbi:hypothetical protein HOY80DRAFT_1003475 [Tuber brumale]|nr:hypothetical protein HOY80DRAFT_1003475 [Tuber brumale]